MRHLLFNNVANVDNGSTSYDNPEFLPKGQIGIFDVATGSNLNLTGANATDKMIIAQGVANGKTPVKTHVLEKSKIKKVVQKVYEAPLRQVTYAGFNGTDGAIDAGAGDYLLKAVNVTTGYEPYPTYQANFFTKDAAVSQYAIAVGIAKEATRNSRFFVSVDVVADIATTQSVGAGPVNATGSAVHGSDQLTASIAITGLAVGDTLRVGHATDRTFPVYTVKAIAGAIITLDRPYAGETASGLALGDGDGIVAQAAGLKLSGALPSPYNGEGIAESVNDRVTSFSTALSDDFGSTPITSAQAPRAGTGSYEHATFLESFTQASEGYFYRMTPFQAEKPEFFADPDLTYDVVSILYQTNTTANIGKSNEFVEIILLFKAGELASATTNLATFFGV